jgi:deoxyribonuclease-4
VSTPHRAELAGTAPRLGAHVSVAGGMPRAIERATDLGCTAIQVFVKNQQQWRGRRIPELEAAAFRTARTASTIVAAMAHASYLVNLATPDDALYLRSIAEMEDEMRRCANLGIESLVVHPGAHLGSGEAAGVRRVADAVRRLIARPGLERVSILLESTAGQGTCIGHRFEHLGRVLAEADCGARLGVCIDTCHVLAAGYDLRSPRGYEAVFGELERVVGLGAVRAFHLNDSKTPLGSRVDRHAPIGQGHLGRKAFSRLLRDPRFAGLPMVLEVPGGVEGYRRDLALLRRMLRGL